MMALCLNLVASQPISIYGYAYGGMEPYAAITPRAYQYANTPVRVGGFFGASSAFITNIRPGAFYGPVMNYPARTVITNTYYPTPRIGGRFGYAPTHYYNLRPGTFVYGGTSTPYARIPYIYRGPL